MILLESFQRSLVKASGCQFAAIVESGDGDGIITFETAAKGLKSGVLTIGVEKE